MSSHRSRVVFHDQPGPRYVSAFDGIAARADDGATQLTGPILEHPHRQGRVEHIAGAGLAPRRVTPLETENGAAGEQAPVRPVGVEERFRTPRLRRRIVQRRRLLARLAAARDHRVVRISAPAGFGKTILAAQLSARESRPTCRIALTDADNDQAVLLGDLVHVLKRLEEIAPRVTLELQCPLPRIDEVVLPLLAKQLAGCEPFVLVLDDVGLVRRRQSVAILSFVVEHAPLGSQVVLVTRTDAEMPLARLRAAGDVFDLGAADLAFDASETRELLANGGVHLSDEQVEQLLERTEGWAAGIALAMLPQHGQAAGRERPLAAIGAFPEIASYLIEEAVELQAPDVRHFLLASSLLQRMSPALCDEALQISHSGQILAALEHDSVFLVPLNDDRTWYRYHRLFREVLEAQLRREAPEVVGPVLGRAAVWHERHGKTSQAFEYAHACGDLAHAGRILLRSAETLIARGEIEAAGGWVARCTREEMGSDPQLALAGAWVALLSGQAAEARRLAAAANTASELDVPSPDNATSLRSSLANLRANLAADGVSQMLRDSEFVVAAEQSAATRLVLDGWRGIGTAHLLDGRPEQAIAAFAEVLSLTQGRPDLNFITINCVGYSALAAADARDWRRARKWAREARAMTTESGLGTVVQSVAAYTAHATVLSHDGLLPQARKALQHVRQCLPMIHAMRWLEADISLRCAQISLDLGDVHDALDLADVARSALNHYPDAETLQGRLTALDARLTSGGQLQLTPSELRLIPFISSHLSLQEIADRLYLSRATIKTHTDSIYRKLGVGTRSSAVERFEALGLSHGSVGLRAAA